MAKHKILYLSPFYDIPSPRAIRTEHICDELGNKYDVTICCFDTGVKFKHSDKNKIVRLSFSKLNYYITNKTYSGYRPKGLIRFFSRAFSFLLNRYFIFPDPWVLENKKIKETFPLSKERYDTIICSMIPFSMGAIGIDLKQNNFPDAKLIFDIGDPLASNSAANNKEKTFKRKFKYESNLLKKADHIIVTNQGTKNHYIKAYKIQDSKLSIIPQGVNSKIVAQSPADLQQSEKIKIVYGGAFYPKLRDPNAFFNLLKESSNLELDVYGSIDSQFIHSCEQINYKGRVGQADLMNSYIQADLLLFVDNRYGLQTSGKIYELLAFKKPILFLFNNLESPVYLLAKQYKHIYFLANEAPIDKSELAKIRLFAQLEHNFDYPIDQFSWIGRAKEFDKLISK